MQKAVYLMFLILFPLSVFSQKTKQEKDTNKGFELFFNAGMYWGSKYNANFYRGDPDPIDRDYADPDMGYVLGNSYLKQEVWRLIYDKHHNDIIDTFFNFEGMSNMKYNLAFSFGIGLRYRFSESFTLSFLFSQVGLTASGLATFGTQGRGANLDKGVQYFDYPIMGKERRIFFEINASYLFETVHPSIFPFVELGVHVNNVKVLKCELIVEDVPFSMINMYGAGTYYDPSIAQPVINPYLGGVGFGFVGGFGVRFAFNKWAALEPVIQVSTEKLHLSSYGKMRPNYNLMIRLVVGDKVFRKW